MKKTINYLFASALTGALIMLGSCGDDKESLPKIDGYNNSDEVAEDNLVAHWTFDGTTEEDISGTGTSNTYGAAATFTEGRIGEAVRLNGSVLKYPAIAGINTANALNNFSVSLWVNALGNKGTATSGFTSFFALIPTGVTDIWGDIHAAAETGQYRPTSDTLKFKNLLNTHPLAGGNSLQDNVAQPNGDVGAFYLRTPGEWSHYVMVWNATTHMFFLYADGQDVGGYTLRGTTAELIMAVPVQAVFGSLASSTIGFAGAPAQQSWNPYAKADIDDVRVFNTTLTTAEINALFNLGQAGR